jgi:hypothetical protein
MKKLVVFLRVEFQDGDHIGGIQGTGFFVFVEEKRLGENRGFIYLVTNRHMAEPEVRGQRAPVRRVSLRLNLKVPVEGVQSVEEDLPLGPDLHWYFPKDDAVDLAILPLAPDQGRYDYQALPTSLLATKDTIESNRIAEGDSVLFAGFFYQFPGQKKIEPIVRQGILAMMPDEPLETTLHKPGRLYLADVHVFGGNSGAPMFVNIGGFRNGAIIAGTAYRLLGVVSGYFFETADFKLQVATTLTGSTLANSGISLVVPAEELELALGSPDLKAQREAEVVREKGKVVHNP